MVIRHALLTLTVSAVLAVGQASSASAHAVLESTSPAAGSTLDSAPAEVILTFDEPPLTIGSQVRVTGPDGSVVSSGPVRVVEAVVHQTLRAGLEGGRYRVAWKVAAEDGHPVSGTFAFTVRGSSGSALTTPATTSSTTGASASAGPSSTSGAAASTSASTSTGSPSPWPLLGVGALALVLVGAVVAAPWTGRRAASGSRVDGPD